MNPWTQVLTQVWYFLENGPKSSAVTEEFPPANRFHYGTDQREPKAPLSRREPVLIIDETGGQIDLDYSPMYLRATEEYQIAVWSDSLDLARVNDLRLKVLAALDAGLPDLGLGNVLDVKLRAGRVTLSLDKFEREMDGRPTAMRQETHKSRKRAVLLELVVTFLIDRSSL